MQLDDQIESHFPKLDTNQKKALKKLGLSTARDLLFYFPSRYSDISELHFIHELVPGETATILGKVTSAKAKKSFKSKIPMGEAVVEDTTGSIKIVWFNQAYLAKMFKVGDAVKVTGKVTESKNGRLSLANPEIEKVSGLPIERHDTLFVGDIDTQTNIRFPIYPETRGLTSKWLYHAVGKILKSGVLETIEEYIPEEILARYHLPKLKTALIWIHTPRHQDDALVARKRFAFEEVFFIQLQKQRDRKKFLELKSYSLDINIDNVQSFVNHFPFALTGGQERAIDSIFEDLEKPHPMSRLLEGDVGSGKTAIAASASYAVIKTRPFDYKKNKTQDFGSLQVAYMAPTEILATQLFESFIHYFAHTGITIGLMTGSGCRKFPTKVASAKNNWTAISRTQLLKWVANGEIPILIGTHALIQKSVVFKHLALVIIDEQHRFGTNQRSKLARKEGFAPHLLSMTATPIPRTLALTIYGDLDLTVLDEMPVGRKHIVTNIVADAKRGEAYEKIREEMKGGRQLYVICPRIDEPDPDKELALQTKSVTAEAKRLKKEVFPDKQIGVLHSKMSKEKKESVMKDFANGAIDILVATSVVEVGVNVPNATMIIIEGAERFGLAQLHQLRGRVMRSSHQPYCFLFADAKTDKTADRLKALKTAKNGFELAELDLKLRGAGELSGAKQWGITDLGMEAIKNIKMVEAARTEAMRLVEKNLVSQYPLLETIITTRKNEMHFE